MAGFFGMFDYSKPGPGVDKNAPKKKNFILFWELVFRKFWKLVQVNLLYVLTCLPVVTVGLGNAGLAYITRNFSREKPVFLFADYKDAVAKNWKQALPVGIVNTALTLLLLFNIYFFHVTYGQSDDFSQMILLALTLALYTIFTVAKYYIYMMMVTFGFKIRQLYKNALLMVTAGLKANLIITFGLLLMYAVLFVPIFFLPGIYGYIWAVMTLCAYVFIVPAFRSMLIQYYIFPVIKQYIIDPYYRDHPEEKKKAGKVLNLFWDDEEDSADAASDVTTDEPVFKDMGSTPTEEPEETVTAIPRQYSERELRGRGRERLQSGGNDDDII